MKVKNVVKLICEHCYFQFRRLKNGKVRRHVYCKKEPRHKQRTPFHTSAIVNPVNSSSTSHAASELGTPKSALLCQRQTASMGEWYWRSQHSNC